MKKPLLIIFAALLSTSVHAATYSYNGSGFVTDVYGLNVGGETYDVTFDTRSNIEWSTDLDFMTLTDATAAATALNSALTASGAYRVATSAGTNNNDFLLPYEFDGNIIFGLHLRSLNPANWYINSNRTSMSIRADFTKTTSPVPLPAAGFLLAGALGGLGLMRRRKKS